MLLNIYERTDRTLVVTPRYAPQPPELFDEGPLQPLGFSEVPIYAMSEDLAASIADIGFGVVEAHDAVLVRSAMWCPPDAHKRSSRYW